jgi:glyoxylase-like metal-dependent hydrolase (beta-lactamase superfamily II)
VYRAVVVVVTGTLQKKAWDSNELPPVEEVRGGLWSIPVPIPDNPLRYVLVYAFELDGGGVALVDAGWNTDDAWKALGDGLASAGGSIADVRAVLVTHIHPDHYGLAGRVREASGAWIGLHPADAVMLRARYTDTDQLVESMVALLVESGVPSEKLPDLALASMGIKRLVTMAEPDVLFEDGRQVDLPGWPLRTIWTPGHSPGHVC